MRCENDIQHECIKVNRALMKKYVEKYHWNCHRNFYGTSTVFSNYSHGISLVNLLWYVLSSWSSYGSYNNSMVTFLWYNFGTPMVILC